ncbi:MAG: hypothetical protein HY529_00570 [Chloroflexi bacterium]|nr:hypothetical protein [Chloroflexota bacterium]
MKSSGRIARIGLPVILLVAISFVLGACNPWSPIPPSDSTVTISVENVTRETLLIFYNNVFIGRISEYAEVSWEADATLPQYIIVAEDLGGNMAAGIHGNVVYATTFTRDDLKGKRTYRVVISATAKSVE